MKQIPPRTRVRGQGWTDYYTSVRQQPDHRVLQCEENGSTDLWELQWSSDLFRSVDRSSKAIRYDKIK